MNEGDCYCDVDFACANHDWSLEADKYLPSYLLEQPYRDTEVYEKPVTGQIGFGVDDLLESV